MKNLIFLTITFLLVSCSTDYSFNSNINKSAINDYFKAGKVQLINKDHPPKKPFNTLGIISGESCQINENGTPASFADARTALRRHAADIGGNAVIINNCVQFNEPDNACISRVLCMGQAITMGSQVNFDQ